MQRGAASVVNFYFRIIDGIAALSMFLIVSVMVVQVFFRYVLNASLIWAEELCRYILIWISFLFVGVAFHRGEFIAIETLSQSLAPAWRYLLKLAVTMPALVFLWLMITNGYSYAHRFSLQTLPALDFIWNSLHGGTLNVSVFWIYVSVPVGCGLLMIHMIVSLVLEGFTLFGRSNAPPPPRPDR